MADTGHWKAFFPEPAGYTEQVFVFSDVLGGASTAEEDADVVLWADVLESDVGFDGVALPFLGDGPAWLDFVENHLVPAFLWRGDDGLKACFDNAVERVEGVDGFGGVANDNQDFGLIHGMGTD